MIITLEKWNNLDRRSCLTKVLDLLKRKDATSAYPGMNWVRCSVGGVVNSSVNGHGAGGSGQIRKTFEGKGVP